MSNCLRLFCLMAFFAGALLRPNLSHAQTFYGEQQKDPSLQLQNQISRWEVYRINAAGLYNAVKNTPESSAPQLHLGQHHWRLDLTPNTIISPDYTLQVATSKGVETSVLTEPKAFRGYDLAAGGRVRLTLDYDFIYGFVEEGGERFYVEPLWYYVPAADRDLFVLYAAKDVNRNVKGNCAVLEGEAELEHLQDGDQKASLAESQACYQVDLAIASDNSMFIKYGGAAGVQNHNIGVINDVEVDYTGNFSQDLAFNIVTQFIVSGTDPWTNSTAAGTLLGSFQTWGNAGNFGVTFDVGELWTNRDFDGGTIGIAYLNGVCNTNKYHCLQDFSSNAELLRCLTSHEIGHNFSCAHDAGTPCTTIMCPFVSSSNTWSSQSVSSVNSFIIPRISNGCLSPCGPPPAPLVADFEWDPNPGCAGQPVHFTDLSTGGITGRTWTFTGGTPPTSTQTNPTVTWNTAGTYNVKLTLAGFGGPVSITKQVIIQPQPVANFTYVVNGLTVIFTNTSTNSTTYDWDFGDSQSSNDPSPVHTYSEAGIYTVKLTTTNDCGTSTKTVIINTAPTADFEANVTTGCAPLTVQFTNLSSSNAATYIWQFPGGSPSQSSLQNPTVVYMVSGTYSVSLTASNGAGAMTTTKINYITVQNLPSSTFTSTVSGLTVSFTNTSVNATTSSWTFGDGGTSTLTNPTHTYATGGTYTVVLTSGNICGTVVNTQTVTLTSAPSAAFSATPTSGCAPLTVQFNNLSTGGATSYNWQFPGGTPSTSTAASPSVVYSTPGTYSVTLTATNAAGNSTATQTNYITVYSGPTAAFTSSISGSTATFTNTTNVGTAPGATTYLWNFGDNSTNSTAANPTHTYTADGSYTVTLTATNSCGTTTFTQVVVIATPPTANFTATNTSGCAPLTVQFTSTSSANSQTYNWQFPGGNPSSSTAQNPVVVYATAGTYSVTLTVSNGTGSNTATQTNLVVVTTTPVTAFTSTVALSTATFTNTTTGATSYAWNFGDNQTSTLANPTHTYTADGTYTVVLTATNGCGSTTSTQTVVIATPPTANFTATNTSGCAPLTVQFTSTSSANAQTYNWQFPGGNPSSSTAQNPVVIYATAGTYSVTLTVSNGAGSNTATQTNLVVVTTTPTAGFTSMVNGQVASFNNTSSGASTYAWNFGDNTSSTAANPTHTYTADGTYTVTLTATNSCGSMTTTQTVVVVTPPTAGFTSSLSSGCAPLTVQFTSTSSANTQTYNWQFPGGTPSSSTAQNPVVVYTTAGIYSVTLTVSNGAGSNTATQTNLVVVTTTPTAAFSSTVSGATATFVNSSSANAGSFVWNFGDNTGSTLANPTHTYAADGTYEVTLTATNNCGSTTFTQNVVIITSPSAGFTANTTTGCVPLTVQFSDLSSGNTTAWSWTFPGGTPATSTQQNPVVVYNTPGVYDVTLVASTAFGSSTYTQTGFITVLGPPTAGFVLNSNGTTFTFSNTSSNATSYFWNFGDGSTSSDANPTHTFTDDGMYPVTLTATNNCGSTTFTFGADVSSVPTAAFTTDATAGCAPFGVQFTNQSSANAATYQWTFQGGDPAISAVANPFVNYNLPGTYTAQLIVLNASGSDTATTTITVAALPAASFTAVPTGLSVVFNNTSANGTSYSWKFGDGEGSTDANPTHLYTAPGTYTVELTVSNACGAATLQQTITVTTTGTEEASWLSQFRVYPNPNPGRFTVEMHGESHEEVEFTLFNAIGQLVHREVADFGTGNLQQVLNCSSLPAALYTLRVRAGDQAAYVKIIVQD